MRKSTRREKTVGLSCLGIVGVVIAALAVLPAPAGSVTPSAVDAGTLTCTTNAQAYCTAQPHSLGAAPVAVVVTAKAPITGSPIAGTVDADSFTATTFRIRVWTPTGVGYANRSVTYSYAAYAGTATPPPTTTTAAPPTTTPPPATTWPAPGTVGLKVATTHTLAGGRFAEPGDFTAPNWTGTGTQADPYTLDRATVTDILRLGCACGSNALDSVWVRISNSWLQGFTGNPTPGDSRMLVVENDGPHLTVTGSDLQPAGTLDAAGIRTDNHCADKGLLAYRPFTLLDSRVSGQNVPVALELERDETGTVVQHNQLGGICSNPGDHTDVYNENGHGSNTLVADNYIDGTRSGGSVVNNGLGLYNDNIGQCDACATTENHTIVGNRFVHYNIGVLSSTNTTLTLGPWVVQDNTFDAPTPLGPSGGSPYQARTPTAQSGNTVNGVPTTF